MNAAASRIPALGLLMIMLLPLHAQNISYTTPGGLKLGFGLGSSYQSSDIENSKGGGFDVWLGSPIYNKENAFFALDWRFRFLAGYNRAYDHRVNLDGSYPNIQLTHFNYDLEFHLTLNRLRERTRIVLSGFLGAGITHGITSADLLDESNNPYDYTSILPNREPSEILADLDQLTDKDFETRLLSRAAIMPTAGIYLGFQFTPHFALGLEHKMNFSLSEHNTAFGFNMDNRIESGSFLDFNNYTSVVFKWALGGGSGSSRRSSTYVPDPGPVPAVSAYPPQVEIITPHTNPYETNESSVKVTARVFNISRPGEITVRLNGQNHEFMFYASLGTIEINTNLRTGTNSLEIVCRNQVGSDSDDLILNYQLFNPPSNVVEQNPYPVQSETVYPPGVRILRPYTSRSNTFEPVEEIVAEISNVGSPAEISFSINGRVTDAFSFDRTTNRLTATVPLNTSTTLINISVSNRFGSDSDSRTITRDSRPADIQFYDTRPAVTQPVETRPAVTQPVETRPAVTQPVETRPAVTQPVETRPAVTQPVETRPAVTQPVETRPAVTQPVETQPEITRPRQTRPVQTRPRQEQPVETQPVETRPVETPPAETRPVQTPPVEERDVDPNAGWVRINPGNAAWEFCLQTRTGNYNRDNLSNSNFSYSGTASSLYFKPIGGGGTAQVNGKTINLNAGRYYLFKGNLRVQVTNKRQGAMGQWSVYIESSTTPSSGTGNNRPESPCETGNGNR